MDAKDLIVDDHTEGQEVEHVSEIMPNARIPILA